MQLELESLEWEHFQSIRAKQRVSHAMLLIGAQHLVITEFAYKLAAALLCLNDQKPCGSCKSCRLLHLKAHPDLYCLEPEKVGGIIKIDQIRDLHDLVFTSAQLANRRVIIINPAEKMNIAAANALLKLLEEPPSEVNFILIAEQISTLPATIISRCQQWRFFLRDHLKADYLAIGQEYNSETERGLLFSQLSSILMDFTEFMERKQSVCAVAEKWLSYDFTSLIWLFYLITAQLIDYKINGCRFKKNWSNQLSELAPYFDKILLFKQLDEINQINRSLQHNLAFNQRLALESLLLGYKGPLDL